MRHRKQNIGMLIALIIVFVAGIFFFHTQKKSNDKTFYIKQDTIDNTKDTIIISGNGGFTGRFPDVIATKEGLLASYYWNDTHAPYVFGDHLGVIRIQRGSSDGENWSSPIDLIDKAFLIKSGLGLWKSGDTYYYSEADANEHNAEFCIEARDPNFARMGEHLIMTFFTRIPWDSGQAGYTYLCYDENYDYTYGRTYVMVSDDEGYTWSRPVEIRCDYLNSGSAKRGNIAAIDDHSVLISLYGYNDASGDTFTTANILASYEKEEWQFKEYCSHMEENKEEAGAFKPGITEVSFTILDKKIYALMRWNGDVMVSEDQGATWKEVNVAGRKDKYVLHQPSLQTIVETGQILASWAEPNETGGRDIFLMLYDPQKDEAWRYENKFCIYHNDEAGDMADPTSILLKDNNVLTIYYDAQKEIVACTKTKLIENK